MLLWYVQGFNGRQSRSKPLPTRRKVADTWQTVMLGMDRGTNTAAQIIVRCAHTWLYMVSQLFDVESNNSRTWSFGLLCFPGRETASVVLRRLSSFVMFVLTYAQTTKKKYLFVCLFFCSDSSMNLITSWPLPHFYFWEEPSSQVYVQLHKTRISTDQSNSFDPQYLVFGMQK